MQAVERIPLARSPARNEVRYYRPDQAGFAALAARNLTELLGIAFVARSVPDSSGGLPNGVIEIWIGTSASPS